MQGGRLDRESLTVMIDAGDVDTVLVVFPDLQGRLMGKRVTGHFFLDDVLAAGGGVEACTYLLAVDIDMDPLPGYRFANWATGYGDFELRPDLATLRLVPWLENTALVLCDLVDQETGEPVEVSPRRILQRQIERAAAAGYTVKCSSELEFYLFKDSYDEAGAKRYAGLTPHSAVIEDYHILQTTKDEYLIRRSATPWTARASRSSSPGTRWTNAATPATSTPASGAWMATSPSTGTTAPPSTCPGHSATTSAAWLRRVGSSRTCSRPTSTHTSATSPDRGRRPRSSGDMTTAPAASASSATARPSGSSRGSPEWIQA